VSDGVRHSWAGWSTAIDLDSPEGRAFHQQRLALLGKVGFLLSVGLFLVVMIVGPGMVIGPSGGNRLSFWLARWNNAVYLLLWLVCRRGSRPKALLWSLDVFIPFVLGFGTVIPSLLWPAQVPGQEWQPVLGLTNVLFARAVFVPSPPRRTLNVGLLAVVPVAAGTLLQQSRAGVIGTGAPLFATNALVWCLCAIAVSTLASAVIYGLQQRVDEARRVGPYTLEDKLGEGAMGVVYRARHALLRRPTAVKLLPPEKAGGASLFRFEREVQLTAQLTHPHTVSVFDYGRTPDGVFYYVMEYLEGLNLEELVRGFGPQEPARVVHVLAQVAGSLAEAHGLGLIHRDIKPANVILCERGGVADVAKVVDFGLARDADRKGSPAVTLPDAVAGTPLYLSPEAISTPEAVDARSDLYALGAVGYYLLAGANVFEGGTVIEVCSHHLHKAPEPPSARIGRPLPDDLERLVLACLEKDPLRRPQSAEEVRQRLLAAGRVSVWSEADARAWWDRHRASIHELHVEAARPEAPADATRSRPMRSRG
jgi:eukaryotic-like serine/threonine-protein kinase